MLASLIRSLPLYLAVLIATSAFAQAPPPPPAGAGPTALAPAPPPPPPPLRAPPGPAVHVDRGPDRSLRFDLHCAEGDTTRACADLAMQLFDKLNAGIP